VGAQTEPDPGFAHFLRYLGVSLALFVATLVTLYIGGLLWTAHILSRTGHRKRDLFNPVIGVRAVWRYTARSVYWQPRPDRPSHVLSGWQRPAAIVGGYVGYPVVFVALLAALGDGDGREWTSENRRAFAAGVEQEGIDPSTAQCVTDHFVEAFPEGLPDENDPRFESESADAFSACGVAWTPDVRRQFADSIEQEGVDPSTAQCVTDYFVEAFPDGVPDQSDPRFESEAASAFSQCGGGR
jgi:hypothetical protein